MSDDKKTTVPGYWMSETSGVLRPAIEAYLEQKPMSQKHLAAFRAYLRQWMAGDWHGPEIEELRTRIDLLVSRRAIRLWLDDALCVGIDPL